MALLVINRRVEPEACLPAINKKYYMSHKRRMYVKYCQTAHKRNRNGVRMSTVIKEAFVKLADE